jgi:SAM-dependent methyltransferase
MTPVNHTCPNCEGTSLSIFYEVEQVPAHSVLLLSTREAALNYPKGDIRLAFCQSCGFISNVAFDPSLHEYSTGYEATQGFSSTFNTFHQRLASRLIEQYELHGKQIIEIGCGQGEFLSLLCELGGNDGIGFDPAYLEERNLSYAKDRITFIKDFYSEKYAPPLGGGADFVCCKMTLEHIHETADFVSMVRRSLSGSEETIVFFQVPDMSRILRDVAFWDIYYEHCSYFSQGSLARLFRSCGFEVIKLATEYDNQYLMIEARPASGGSAVLLAQEKDLGRLREEVAYFAANYEDKLERWRRDLEKMRQSGQRAVIWGAGSKAVAFLTTLGIQDEIEYAVDINPYKHGTYMAGTGHEIVAPAFLQAYKPDVVIVMNPIYCREIQQELDQLGVTTTLMPV